MNDKNLHFPIPNELILPYVNQAVTASIVSALGDSDKLISEVVALALSQKVDKNGIVSKYDSDNRFTFPEVIAKNKIREIAKEAIVDMAEAMRPKIKEAILKELRSKHALIAKTLVDGIITSLASDWHVTINMLGGSNR